MGSTEMEDIPMAIPRWITQWIQQEDEEIEYTAQEQEIVTLPNGMQITQRLDTTFIERFEREALEFDTAMQRRQEEYRLLRLANLAEAQRRIVQDGLLYRGADDQT